MRSFLNFKLMKKIFTFVLSSVVWSVLYLPVFAQNVITPTDRLRNTAGAANLSTTSVTPQSVVVSIILIILGLLGITFLVLIIYSGFTWMTSQGDKDKIAKAKQTISNSVIGFAIIIASYAIVDFISKAILNSIQDRFLEY